MLFPRKVTGSVRIVNLRVPKTYLISNQENFKRLILDCEFEFHPLDMGFVLKWYHQNKLFYQWIANRSPYVFVSTFYILWNCLKFYYLKIAVFSLLYIKKCDNYMKLQNFNLLIIELSVKNKISHIGFIFKSTKSLNNL